VWEWQTSPSPFRHTSKAVGHWTWKIRGRVRCVQCRTGPDLLRLTSNKLSFSHASSSSSTDGLTGCPIISCKNAAFRPEALAQSELYSRCERCGSWKGNLRENTGLGAPRSNRTRRLSELPAEMKNGNAYFVGCLNSSLSNFFPHRPPSPKFPIAL